MFYFIVLNCSETGLSIDYWGRNYKNVSTEERSFPTISFSSHFSFLLANIIKLSVPVGGIKLVHI